MAKTSCSRSFVLSSAVKKKKNCGSSIQRNCGGFLSGLRSVKPALVLVNTPLGDGMQERIKRSTATANYAPAHRLQKMRLRCGKRWMRYWRVCRSEQAKYFPNELRGNPNQTLQNS